ncbi:MAG: 1-acyl-sn-glycerol-3-phosphate acyltransferase [Bradymonadaceae bacterium]
MPKLSYEPNDLNQRHEGLLRTVARLVRRVARPYHRAEITGLERIPEGPALYVGNHNGALLSIDTFLALSEVVLERGMEAMPYALAHSVIIRMPVMNQILVPLGAVEASWANAERVLEAGHKVLVYPGGEIEAMRPFSERHQVKFSGRRGWIRLALRSDVPIVPVAAAGAHATLIILDDQPRLARMLGLDELMRTHVWPLTFSIPWGLTFGPPPPHIPLPVKIAIEFLEPMTFDRVGPEAAEDEAYVDTCAYRVEAKIQHTVDRLVAQKL